MLILSHCSVKYIKDFSVLLEVVLDYIEALLRELPMLSDMSSSSSMIVVIVVIVLIICQVISVLYVSHEIWDMYLFGVVFNIQAQIYHLRFKFYFVGKSY